MFLSFFLEAVSKRTQLKGPQDGIGVQDEIALLGFFY